MVRAPWSSTAYSNHFVGGYIHMYRISEVRTWSLHSLRLYWKCLVLRALIAAGRSFTLCKNQRT